MFGIDAFFGNAFFAPSVKGVLRAAASGIFGKECDQSLDVSSLARAVFDVVNRGPFLLWSSRQRPMQTGDSFPLFETAPTLRCIHSAAASN